MCIRDSSAAGHDLDELLKVSYLLSSLSGIATYEPTIAAIRTMDKATTTWEAVRSRLIDVANEQNASMDADARLAVSAATSQRQQRGRRVHFDENPRVLGQQQAGRSDQTPQSNPPRNNQRNNGGSSNRGRRNRNRGQGQGQASNGQPGTNDQPRLTVLH